MEDNIIHIVIPTNNSNNDLFTLIMEYLNNNNYHNDIINQSFNEQEIIKIPCSSNFLDTLEDMEIIQEDIDSDLSCAICQESFKLGETVIGLPCHPQMHYFHKINKECPGIIPWLKKTNTCPVCRSEFPIEEVESVIEYESNENTEEHDLNEFINQPPPDLIINPSDIINTQEGLLHQIQSLVPIEDNNPPVPIPNINDIENIQNIEENIINMFNSINEYTIEMSIDDSGFPIEDIDEAIRRSIN